MASSMARRLALIVATAAAAMVVAVPAPGAHALHADRPWLGTRHRPLPVRRARVCPARLGLRRDPGPLLHGHHPLGPAGLGADAHPARKRQDVVLHLGSLEDHGRRRGWQPVEDDSRWVLPRRARERRAACASSTRPPARASSSTSPAPSAWAPRRRSGSTAPSASAGRTTTGTAYLRVIRSGSSLMLVDVVPLEYYLRGVVPSEMPSSWLPAGAPRPGRRRSLLRRRDAPPDVALRRVRRHAQPGVRPDGARGGGARTPPSSATAHRVLWYSGNVAVGFFSSSSGGWTASSRRPGAAAASRTSSPSATATTGRRA